MNDRSYPMQTEVAGQTMPFNMPLANAQEEAAKLAERISALADRLCGGRSPEPMNAVGGRLQTVPNGLFDDIQERGADIGIKLDRIRSDVSRIERALP